MHSHRALLVGAGGMGQAWADNLIQNVHTDLVGWVDLQPERAATEAEKRKLSIHTGSDLGQALSDLKPDFLVDVTTPESHCATTIAALQAGVPVIGEKPMATSMDEARRMVAASEKSGQLYMVSQSRRYNAKLQAYRKLIERLGPLGILTADFFIGAHFGGFRDEMASPLILDMAIHTFDAARYLSGADPVSVYCEEYSPSWSWYKGDASANAIFEMSDGLRFCYRGSWCSDGLHTSWESEWRAVGSNGTATWDGNELPEAELVTKSGTFFSEVERSSEIPMDIGEGINGSLCDFLNALEHGLKPMGECHDNIKSLAMVFAAVQSSSLGERVRADAV